MDPGPLSESDRERQFIAILLHKRLNQAEKQLQYRVRTAEIKKKKSAILIQWNDWWLLDKRHTIPLVDEMSGEPPNGFEIHSSDNAANIITASQLSDEIRDWIGVEGFLDMRAYVRFRFLDYFKNKLLPDELDNDSDSPSISEEEMAINALVIDFTLKHKYYFTLCLLISEIQAFSRFDERLKPLLTQISRMSTDEMENISPLLDREQVSRVLCALNIDPRSRNGMDIHQAYFRDEKRRSLIQLVLSYNNDNFEALREGVAADDCVGNSRMDGGNDFKALIEYFIDQITQVKRRVKQIEFKYSQGGSGMRHSRRTKNTEIELRRSREKFGGLSRDVEMLRGSVQVLMELVDQIRVQGQEALQRCAPYINHVLALTSHIGRIEVAVRRIKRKLTAQDNRSKARAFRRETNARLKKASIRLGVNIGELSEVGALSQQSLLRSFRAASIPLNLLLPPSMIHEGRFSESLSILAGSSWRGSRSHQTVAERSNSTRNSTADVLDKTVQTDVCRDKNSLLLPRFHTTGAEVAIQTGLVATADAHTQSDSTHQYDSKGITPPLATAASIGVASRETYSTDLPSKREDDDVGRGKEKQRDNSVQTDVASSQWKETAVIMEQNYELQGKIQEQSKRINYLTARIAQLHEELAKQKIEEQTHRTRVGMTRADASTNTNVSGQIPRASGICKTDSKHELRVLKSVPRFDTAPLKKTLAAAKAEIAFLKRERRNIQDISRSSSKNDTGSGPA